MTVAGTNGSKNFVEGSGSNVSLNQASLIYQHPLYDKIFFLVDNSAVLVMCKFLILFFNFLFFTIIHSIVRLIHLK